MTPQNLNVKSPLRNFLLVSLYFVLVHFTQKSACYPTLTKDEKEVLQGVMNLQNYTSDKTFTPTDFHQWYHEVLTKALPPVVVTSSMMSYEHDHDSSSREKRHHKVQKVLDMARRNVHDNSPFLPT